MVAASIHDHVGFTAKDQANGATGITHIDRLEIGVENQYRRVHSLHVGVYYTPEADDPCEGFQWYGDASHKKTSLLTIEPGKKDLRNCT